MYSLILFSKIRLIILNKRGSLIFENLDIFKNKSVFFCLLAFIDSFPTVCWLCFGIMSVFAMFSTSCAATRNYGLKEGFCAHHFHLQLELRPFHGWRCQPSQSQSLKSCSFLIFVAFSDFHSTDRWLWSKNVNHNLFKIFKT